MYFLAPYTNDSIKKQYKTLAKKLHPDKLGGNESEFKLMKYEFDVLIKLISAPKQKIQKRRLIIKKTKKHPIHYHITIDKNVNEVLKTLKKIFK